MNPVSEDPGTIQFGRTEILWMNAHYQGAKRDDRIPIRLNRKEKEQNKLNPSRMR